MNVLVVGGGGREHAICWKLAQSSKVDEIFCAPGNAGIEKVACCVAIGAEDIEGICDFAVEKKIDLAVIGPEAPLAMGIVDELESKGVRTFGPNRKCARLEASKAFTKSFLARHSVPTADYKEYTDIEVLRGDIGIFGYPMVLKADGLAAGKGVVLAADEQEAEAAIEDMMGARIFGSAGDKVVVEECLVGVEASVLCFVDENTILPMESAQDYKRIYDGDEGPNTGGMGSYSPSLLFDEAMEERIQKEILDPTLAGFQADGLPFKGVLFIGLMLTDEGPKVIEFNNRFGDPETQSVLPRMESDLLEVLLAVTENRLSEVEIKWSERKATCVVMASGGYPGAYLKGVEIFGLSQIAEEGDPDVMIFHGGTMRDDVCHFDRCYEAVVTGGGRVLGVTALGDTHEASRKKAYDNVKKIEFQDMQYRKDIGVIVKK